MSERRAKRNRKEAATEVKKKSGAPSKAIANIVVSVVIAAVAAVGIYASYNKIKSEAPVSTAAAGQQTQTVADLAEEKGIPAEELLKKCGMTDAGLTAESDANDMYAQFTIDSFAKYEDKTADELKAEYGIESLDNGTNWQEAQMSAKMGKIAEMSGMSFEEFAEQNGLPAEITKDTTYQGALEIMQAQAQTADDTSETEE